MKRLVLVSVLVLVGCAPESVSLLTDTAHEKPQCYASSTTGLLVVDPKYGTGLTAGAPVVMWPRGFTGRRLGSEVEVLSPTGNVVAITGKTYQIPGGLFQPDPSIGVSSVWLACEPVIPK